MLIPLLNEACYGLYEGLGTAHDIDTGVKLGLNPPMGPLELADLLGLDTCLASWATASTARVRCSASTSRPAGSVARRCAASTSTTRRERRNDVRDPEDRRGWSARRRDHQPRAAAQRAVGHGAARADGGRRDARR